MKLSSGIENLGLPDYMKFGLELEVENLNYSKITKYVKDKNWHTDKDPSLTDSGVECVSPVLTENSDSLIWQDLEEICMHIKECPNDPERESYTDHTCGGHVHFDASIFQKNPDIMNNFLRLWAESEELVYKMCNEKNDPIRPGAIESSHTTLVDVFKTLTKSPIPEKADFSSRKSLKEYVKLSRSILRNINSNSQNAYRKLNSILSDAILNKDGMASPIGNKIKQQLASGKLKLGKPKSKIYRDVLVKNKLTPERFRGLNLTNIGNKKKNTIEFRMSNGSINPQTIKENVFLYASIIDSAVKITMEPEKMQTKLQEFYNKDVSEEEKASAFLNLIMDSAEDRQVYMDRWASVKDAPVFQKEIAFAKNTFKKDDMKSIATKTPAKKVNLAFEFIKDIKKSLTQTYDKEDVNLER